MAKGKWTLEFTYEFGYDDDQVSFGLMAPYTYDDLTHDSHIWSNLVKKEKHYFFRKKLLCYTLMGRKVFYFEAYKADDKLKSGNIKNKRIIVLTARVHPGEACSSYVLKGFIEQLLNVEDNKHAQFLRDHFFFVIVPMLNPDGVSVGNSRCSFSGNDLNQTWANPDRYIHPEIYYTKKLIMRLKKENDIIFYTDFHGSYTKRGTFVYGCHQQANPKATREFPHMLECLINYFNKSNCK